MCNNDCLEIFFAYALPILVITCVDLYQQILDAAAITTKFKHATTATVDFTVASTGLNARNLLGNLILWNLGNRICEVVSCL